MPLHPQSAALLDALAQLGAPPLDTQDPVSARRGFDAMIAPSDHPIHHIRDLDADGVPVRLYRPNDRTDLGLLVYYHGGGWVLGGLDSHDDVCRRLANALGHAVLSVDYRLAPEHPFPEPLTDSVNALRWAHANATELGVDSSRIAVGGDSAGGNLAAVVAQLQPVPLRYQMLIYPVTDARRGSKSYVDNAEGYRLTAASMKWFCDHYLSGEHGAEDDPRVSPLCAPDTALVSAPPALVITAEYDPLRDEGEDYARRLIAAGVPCTLTRYYGQIHGFFSMSAFVDDAPQAIAQAAAAVKQALER
ncbi:MAG: alpha/beta hydrolase [Actinomycetota bacterium]|nr:alpha/beta hydrolase [Actinomycetota bacterium]MDA3024631.1 alpha/beta hydrolase [Actinomycetota bacterium]